MSEYTKGPWKQHHLKNYVNIVDDRDYCVTSICKVDSNGENDAHLIAAAPDMYEALKLVLDSSEKICENACSCGIGEMCHLCRSRSIARVALAKAKGE